MSENGRQASGHERPRVSEETKETSKRRESGRNAEILLTHISTVRLRPWTHVVVKLCAFEKSEQSRGCRPRDIVLIAEGKQFDSVLTLKH
jgi:hypothetical protein